MKRTMPVERDEAGLAALRAQGVTRALTLWPEWLSVGLRLDKFTAGGENRPRPPPAAIIGKRIALHAGKYIGGRASAYWDGLRSVFGTAAESGWKVYRPHEAVYTLRKRNPGELVHRDGIFALNYEGEREGDIKIVVPDDIVTSAVMATAVVTGYRTPTPSPTTPWQMATPIGEKPSYLWMFKDLEVLPKPIACPGMQGVWPL